ncbi:hypothetical protein K3495_g11944 [Podosphaera aphanis]|nr:hypothetical protein K3495_g11944 [Podosphaera aphanis]
MYTSTYIFAILALLFATVFTAPLNINMGAYSPALLVGDGAITFKDSKAASGILSTLEGSDADGAAGGNAGAKAVVPGATPGAPNLVQAGEVTPKVSGVGGLGRKMVPSSEDNQ